METAKQALQLLSKLLKAAPIPDPFKSAVTAIPDIALQIIDIVDGVKGNVDDAKALAVYIATLTETEKTMRPFEKPDELNRIPDMKMRLEEFQGVLEKIKEDIKTLMSRRLGSKILSYDSDASKLADMKRSVDNAMNQLQRPLSPWRAMFTPSHLIMDELRRWLQTLEERDRTAAQERVQEQYRNVLQENMPHEGRLLCNVDTGAAKKPPCLVGTREHVLARIKEWIDDTSSSSKRCYLLLGQAGIGKSAIASSVAKLESHRLGAVFHFTREEQARNKGSILALAQQLSRWGARRLRSEIAEAIELAVQDGLNITQMTPENQFHQLIEGPLMTLDNASPALVIILDALDECDDAFAVTLLRLLGGLLGKLPSQVKLLHEPRRAPPTTAL
ncbi:hypothetical protein FRB95_000601 [Tulasnella sp. JGI-2019a]|nr:hypothetical protein FRB93_013501 [Tulasnella sp. JGI-2019a]KAG9022191.1 hypothetical protein FRB95_000601 [Tulasnella sp. JGI-2019a]